MPIRVSMHRPSRRTPAALIAALLLAACAAPPPAPVRDLSQPLQTVEVYRIVRPGDTLYSLSWAAGVDYRQLAAWNALTPPYVIRPGQRVSLVPTGRETAADRASPPSTATVSALPRGGDTGARSVTVAPTTQATTQATTSEPPSTTVAASPTASRTSAKAPARQPAPPPAPAAVEPSVGSPPADWTWPVRGRVVADYAKSRGMDIAVASGTPVKASAGGTVVYAGSGLRGYGQLVIVKHNNEYLSAYGHNRKLLVQEGDRIVAGQVIAESGSAPGKGEQVHFEIRRNGQPVDPANLLPRRS